MLPHYLVKHHNITVKKQAINECSYIYKVWWVINNQIKKGLLVSVGEKKN